MNNRLTALLALGFLASSCVVAPESRAPTSSLSPTSPTRVADITSPSSNPTEALEVKPTSTESQATQVQVTSAVETPAEIPLQIELSRVLTHSPDQLIDYFTSAAPGYSFFIPSEGWQQVLVEVAAISSNWQSLPECANEPEVIVVDTGGYQRPAGKLYVVDFTGLARLLPRGAAQRLWVTADIPNNQEPDQIIVDVCGDTIQLDAKQAIPHNFASQYVHPDLPTVPGQVILEIPDTARLTFDFAATRFIEYEPAFSPGIRHLYVPTTVENIGGFDLPMRYQFQWSNYVSVSGLASNGFLVGTFDDPSADYPTIPPGATHTGDVRFGVVGPRYYPSIDPDTLRVSWMWLSIQFHVEQPPGPFQMIFTSE